MTKSQARSSSYTYIHTYISTILQTIHNSSKDQQEKKKIMHTEALSCVFPIKLPMLPGVSIQFAMLFFFFWSLYFLQRIIIIGQQQADGSEFANRHGHYSS